MCDVEWPAKMTGVINIDKTKFPDGTSSYTVIDQEGVSRIVFNCGIELSTAIAIAEQLGYIVNNRRQADA